MEPGPCPAIFLSASVPKTTRDAAYWTTADVIAIQAAIAALARVVLGRRRLVFGGHPSITPMILLAAKARRIEIGRWVTLYQSAFYEPEFPPENEAFASVILTPAVTNDPAASQRVLRERMLADNRFSAAVFIGGMEGVEAEFEMLRRIANPPNLLPVASTGGAALRLYDRVGGSERLRDELTYDLLFQDLLDLPADD
jgi:hypothetical protein